MTKLLLILLISLCFEAIGVVFLSKGLKEIGEMGRFSFPEVARLFRAGITNPHLLTGIFFEAIFFAGILILMSQGAVSFIWPLTSLGFVLTTLAARYVLNEEVSLVRWMGVLLIMLGAGCITWSEQTKTSTPLHKLGAQQ